MKHFFQTKFLFALLALTALCFPSVVFAQSFPRLDVVFETQPLFANDDFKPLDRMCRYVRVTNLSNAVQPVIMEAINKVGCESGPACLSTRLDLEVKLGVATLYHKFLNQFYADKEATIDTISPEATKQYDLCVTFTTGPDDDNIYQMLSTGFDLLVGYQGAQTNTSGGSQPPGLQIKNEASVVATSSAAINVTWLTDYPATSQVLYGPASGGPYTLNLSLPNYGYPFASIEDSVKVLSHSVLLTGLTPGTTYRYRVVSHASPATVSYEHEFTVPADPVFASLAMNVGGTVPEYQDEKATVHVVQALVTGGSSREEFLEEKGDAPVSLAAEVFTNARMDAKRIVNDFERDPERNARLTFGLIGLGSFFVVALWIFRRRIAK